MFTTIRLIEIKDEVRTWCAKHGWDDMVVQVPEAMALIHTEIAEAWQAYKNARFIPYQSDSGGPDGFGIELADVFIRTMDNIGRYEVRISHDLVPHVTWDMDTRDEYDMVSRCLNDMHACAAGVTESYRITGEQEIGRGLGLLLGTVDACAQLFDLNLELDYLRKMEYNATRPYRNGNKRI
jgi:hypothetical protein